MRKFYFVLIISLLCAAYSLKAHDPNIHLGNSNICITLNCNDSLLSNTQVFVETSPIFSGLMEMESHKLTPKGNSFHGIVPTETPIEIVGFQVVNDNFQFGSMVAVNQNNPTKVVISLDSAGSIVDYHSNSSDSLTIYEWSTLSDIFANFISDMSYYVPDSAYQSWELVRDYQLGTILPGQLNNAFGNRQIPEYAKPWFLNSLKCRFAAIEILPYVKAAERMNGIAVDEPPMEAYTFLNEIDYSSNLLKRLPYTGLKSFIYALLRFPDGGFDKIGDMDIDEWEDNVAKKLSPALESPTKLLLDLLAGMSYIEQIEVNNVPLSEIQIANIIEGFTNDIGLIILNKNKELLNLANQAYLLDFSEDDFDLDSFMRTKFNGRPVVIDFWNTWCAPCIDAINTTMELKKEYSQEVAFLYISSTSSPKYSWRTLASKFGGTHIRVSEDDFYSMLSHYDLEVLPSYIFFSKAHEVRYKFSALGELQEFKTKLSEIVD
ncbi:thiol-disulfide oxidoreductase ResA [Muribaculaceae bacterium]|jgi:Thiol-disulfide isomerase and thioredoxins|nr:thiol-disulfide oxidoreductase ResA [Muribaculaceae bacterium]